MDWANERYIKLYTRDTGDWLLWPWQTRGLFLFILRKVDRSGLLQLGKRELEALAAVCHMPSRDVTEWIAPLVDDGCVIIRDGVLCVPNFIAAQETIQTDRSRQRASRERLRSNVVDSKDSGVLEQSRAVTGCHAPSRAVTERHYKTRQEETKQEERDQIAREAESDPAPLTVEEQTRVRVIGKSTPPMAGPESGYDLARRVFAEEWRAKKGRDYVWSTRTGKGSDDWAMLETGRFAREGCDPQRAEARMRHWCKAYMREGKAYLVDEGHPARCLTRDVANKYGEPKQAKPAIVPQARAPTEPAMSVEEQGRRAASLADMVKKIGGGAA